MEASVCVARNGKVRCAAHEENEGGKKPPFVSDDVE